MPLSLKSSDQRKSFWTQNLCAFLGLFALVVRSAGLWARSSSDVNLPRVGAVFLVVAAELYWQHRMLRKTQVSGFSLRATTLRYQLAVVLAGIVASIVWFILTDSPEFAITVFASVLLVVSPPTVLWVNALFAQAAKEWGERHGIHFKTQALMTHADKLREIIYDKNSASQFENPDVWQNLNFWHLTPKPIDPNEPMVASPQQALLKLHSSNFNVGAPVIFALNSDADADAENRPPDVIITTITALPLSFQSGWTTLAYSRLARVLGIFLNALGFLLTVTALVFPLEASLLALSGMVLTGLLYSALKGRLERGLALDLPHKSE